MLPARSKMKQFLILLILIGTYTAVSAQTYRVPLSPIQQLEKEYCSPLFSSVDGTTISLMEHNNENTVMGHQNILSWLQGRVAGLQVYQIRSTSIAFIRNTPATIFVNEMRTDASILESIPVTDIALVKVIRNPFVLGGSGSAIAVYTKKGLDEEEEG
jgi:hypothetical protein